MSESVARKITKKSSSSNSRVNWRKYQGQARASKRVALGVGVLVILLLLVGLSKIIGFIGGLNKPYSPDTKYGTKQYYWDGTSTINLIIKSDKLALVSFNPVDKTATILKISDETYLNVPYGFGQWPARSIYDLGQSENPPIGAKLLKTTISQAFGAPVDGYLILPKEDFSLSSEKTIEKLRQNPLSYFSILKGGKTDLSFMELWGFVWGIRGVRFDKVKAIDLAQSNITSWMLLADGSRVLDLDQPRLDQLIQSQMEDSRMGSEALSVGIFNSTSHPGLAERAARLVTNMGGRVVLTSNTQDHLANSIVFGKPSYTKVRLEQIFAPSCLSGTGLFGLSKGDKCAKIPCRNGGNQVGARCAPGNLDSEFSRADVNIILGEGYFTGDKI